MLTVDYSDNLTGFNVNQSQQNNPNVLQRTSTYLGACTKQVLQHIYTKYCYYISFIYFDCADLLVTKHFIALLVAMVSRMRAACTKLRFKFENILSK